MRDSHGCSIACLCVSDINKELLLSCMDLIPMLVDSLLLDPEHPRQENTTLLGKTDWEAAKGPVQAVSVGNAVVYCTAVVYCRLVCHRPSWLPAPCACACA
jgi:hypothetical protein|eukprot:COSAG06_NODE_1482_length_9317_cov_8.315578_7_plen_101_part_00